jgi:anti-anti-sigma factor
LTSVTRLDEAVAAQIAGQAVQLTIDATNLRYADLASMRTLVTAAMKLRTRDGSMTLLNPQPPVARMLDLLRVDELFSIRAGQRIETQPDTSAGGGIRSPADLSLQPGRHRQLPGTAGPARPARQDPTLNSLSNCAMSSRTWACATAAPASLPIRTSRWRRTSAAGLSPIEEPTAEVRTAAGELRDYVATLAWRPQARPG